MFVIDRAAITLDETFNSISIEILDYIFSFLVSHGETLNDCSRDPVLFPVIERHFYYSIVVYFDNRGETWEINHTTPSNCFGPVAFSKAISKNPRILHYVRILRIHVLLEHNYNDDPDLRIKKRLDKFAETLLKFPALECIKLITSKKRLFEWPGDFRAALEDRFNLPTLKELHIEGNQNCPCSLIDNSQNIKNLSLCGEFFDMNDPSCGSNLPQLKSLTVLRRPIRFSTLALLKSHINELHSLRCVSSALRDIPELLEVCSQTLKKLDIDLLYSMYVSTYMFHTGEVCAGILHDWRFPELSSIPPHLEQLTIRAPIDVDNKAESDEGQRRRRRGSYLPAAAEIINFFVAAPPFKHLILDIDISLAYMASNLDEVDFAGLAFLGPASLSIPRIDLYVHTDKLAPADTLTQFLASLVDFGDVMRSIKEGIIVIHSEEAAPDYKKLPF